MCLVSRLALPRTQTKRKESRSSHLTIASFVIRNSEITIIMAGNPLSNRSMSFAKAPELKRKTSTHIRKEGFLIFIKALVRDLAENDPAMHARAKRIIQNCTDKKKREGRGFDFESTLRTRLMDAVGEARWRHVERDLHRKQLAQERTNTTIMAPTKEIRSTETSVASQSDTSSLVSDLDDESVFEETEERSRLYSI